MRLIDLAINKIVKTLKHAVSLQSISLQGNVGINEERNQLL
jgi:hypothetical protein